MGFNSAFRGLTKLKFSSGLTCCKVRQRKG